MAAHGDMPHNAGTGLKRIDAPDGWRGAAPDAELTPLSSYGRSELRNVTVDARILSAVAFKSGTLRIVLDNGRHLNLRRDTSAPAVVRLGDSVVWERPTAGWGFPTGGLCSEGDATQRRQLNGAPPGYRQADSAVRPQQHVLPTDW